MQTIDFRRFIQGAALAATIAVAGAVTPSVASAQGAGDAGTAQTTDYNDDDGDKSGWFGLLGLAGLLGLRRRDNVVHTDTTRRP